MINTVLLSLVIALTILLALVCVAFYIKHYAPKKQPIQPHTDTANALTIAPMSDALSDVLKNALAEMKDCKAIAYVDTRANRLVGMEAIAHLPEPVIALIAAVTSDLFTAPNLMKVSNIFKEYKGKSPDSSNFNEILIRGEGTMYIFLRAQSDIHHVGVFSCVDEDEQSSSFGLLLHQARAQMQKIELAAHAAFLAE